MKDQPKAILRGSSPRGIGDAENIRTVADGVDSLKVDCGSHYEHFRRTGEQVRHQGQELDVFVWSHITHVAE